MALSETLPYGLRDVKVRPVVNGVVGAAVDLPNSQIFSFDESEEFTELRGDDKVRARRGKGPSVNWSLENGGISIEAYAVIAGGTVTSSGTTPNQIKTFNKKNTDARPEFLVEGQSISESGGDMHTVLYRCKAEGKIAGSQEDGTFWITKCDGVAIGRISDGTIYEFIQNETVTAIDTLAAALPVIVSLSPAGRKIGEQINITGRNFTGVTGVTIDGNAVTAVNRTLVSDSLIVATIPASSVGAADVIVTTAAGASAAVSYTVAV